MLTKDGGGGGGGGMTDCRRVSCGDGCRVGHQSRRVVLTETELSVGSGCYAGRTGAAAAGGRPAAPDR